MTLILPRDVQAHKKNGSWRTLEKRAVAMVADAARHAGMAFEPRLGGGTRLMLSLDHRISDDINLFIQEAVLSRMGIDTARPFRLVGDRNTRTGRHPHRTDGAVVEIEIQRD